ncbi:hypothetical protein V6R85_02580 [Agrobacterium sp. CCNWLW32]|uniref:hypothetical protein n=1 Tax=Agrobacterium sp. CCNWLW32 TaxID=3122072 RepID=UPI000458B939|nr:hypothetical protein AWN88_11320 [Agrobacterium tumefaciens]KAJ36247.1 hypothetical protein BW45_23145 [Agrobacterium tumefaciens]
MNVSFENGRPVRPNPNQTEMLFLPAKDTLYRALYGGSVDEASRDMVNRYAKQKGGIALRVECPRDPADIHRSTLSLMDYALQDVEVSMSQAFADMMIYGRGVIGADFRGRIYGRRADVFVADDLEAA